MKRGTNPRKRGDAHDTYNDDMARRAVGSLFDDEDDLGGLDDLDDLDDVDDTGADTRTARGTRRGESERGARRRDHERGARDEDYERGTRDEDYERGARDEDYERGARDDEYVRDTRDDEYVRDTRDDAIVSGFDSDDDHTPPKRDRSKEPTPAPKPALRAQSPTRAAIRRERPAAETPPEDDIDTLESFRRRYRGRDAVPSSREATPARRARQSARTYDDHDDAPETRPVTWIFATLAFVFLIVLAILVYRINIVTGQLKEANAKLEGTPSTLSELTEAKLEVERLEAKIDAYETEIESLQSELTLWQSGDDDNPTGVTTSPTPTQAPATGGSGLPTTYTVQSGDNLTKIAKKFYDPNGTMSAAAITGKVSLIMQANNMTTDNIAVGDVLTIPE